jgi:Transposase DNA-binding
LENIMDGMAATFAKEQFGTADLGDERLNARLLTVGEQLAAHPSETFPKRFSDPADLQAFYRLMENKRVTHAKLMAMHTDVTWTRMRTTPGVVLLIHDTTVLDYSGLKAIKDLGQIGNGHGRGLYCHNCLAVEAATRQVLGLAGQVLHRRRKTPKGERRTARQKNPHRESRLWKTLSKSIPAMPMDGPADQLWVDVADRGADITEFLDYEEQVGKKYTVRSQHNRWIEREIAGKNGVVREKIKLHALARSLPGEGAHMIEVPAKNGQKARTAQVSVSWQQVTILPPRQKRGEERGVPLTSWVVRVGETDPPQDAEPLEWILLTNVPVMSLVDAFERIEWYRLRWIIEEYHKAQKTGVEIENMQFSHLDRLEPAIALLSVMAVLLLTLRDQSRAPDAMQRPATDCVPHLWVRMLSTWRHKQPRMDWSVHDFFYALARLGGHQNRKHDHSPGWLVLWRGWMHLQSMLEGAAALGITEM